jgi:hypothetical protein
VWLPWKERLEALHPGNPAAYLELGEEIQGTPPEAATTGAQAAALRRLVIELYTLAFEIDRTRPGMHATAGSAARALASLSARGEERRWLEAVSRTLDRQQAPPPWMARPEVPSVESEAFRAATCVGLIRSGDGIQARKLLERPEVRSLLERSNLLLERLGFSGGSDRLFREAERWPCPTCANQRVTKRAGSPNDPRLCTNCDGVPGPKLSDSELLALLQFESWLLDGRQRSWAAQTTADAGAPLRDPDPAGVAGTFRVDASKVYWRRGAWRTHADGTGAAPVPQAPASPAAPADNAPAAPPPTSGS